MTFLTPEFRDRLTANAENADRLADWPASSWDVLKEAGVLGWSIPSEFHGAGLGAIDGLTGLEEIASCCLTTAFILSQREAAVRQLLKGPDRLKEEYLPRVASGTAFATVGLSQLTTSRQHGSAAVTVQTRPGGKLRLRGEIPWVTAADRADAIIVGARLEDSRQILIAVPSTEFAGHIAPPLPLSSLVGSRTSLVECNDISVDPGWILMGPSEHVMGKVGGGGLETSCLAIGLAAAAIQYIEQESVARPFLAASAAQLRSTIDQCRTRLHQLSGGPVDPEEVLRLRTDCTRLTLRATQAGLTIAKGNGFLSTHPAQRWARQALFFLVWSCPRPIAEGILASLVAGP